MRERILMACVAGFLLGIFYASFYPLTLPLAIACIGSAGILLIAAHVTDGSTYAYMAVFFACMFLLGAFRYEAGRLAMDPDLASRVDSRIVFEGAIVAEPDIRERNTRLTVRVDTIDAVGLRNDTRVLAIAPAFTRANYGDVVTVTGVLRKPESFETGEGRSFNYPQYLASRGISYEVAFADVEVQTSGGDPAMRVALYIKSTYIRGLRSVLPEPYAGLAAGITAGDKRSVGSELSDVFQQVSLVHILVLSGYNITVVMSALLRMLGGVSRMPKLAAALGTVAFFILISGAAPSSVRAGAMAFAAVIAGMYGRTFVALRVLIAIVVCMVAWDPYVLAFDPGFQLSVLATLGLIAFAGPVAQRLSAVTERFALREIVSATIATQITVLPLLLYQNGMLSLVALPANILALIAVPLAMAFSGIAAVAGAVLGSWGILLALPAYMLLRYIVLIADLFASFPYASVTVSAFNAWWLLVAYLILGCVFFFGEIRKPGKAPAMR
ncbi:MAG: ComEC family competence protein [Candidatus Pacebacteria bacterium]|nr:ComEC family competence protein [Candidatus Paceibacterota bacterium]